MNRLSTKLIEELSRVSVAREFRAASTSSVASSVHTAGIRGFEQSNLNPRDANMIKLSHLSLVILVTSLKLQTGCAIDIDSDIDQTSSTSEDLFQVYEVRSFMNHKCLDLLGFNPNNGARVGMWDCWDGANQLWYWNGEEIRSLMHRKCLDVLGFNNNNGAAVGMWDCWGGSNQRWYQYGNQIRSRFNNKCLDIYAFNHSNGAAVVMWDCWGGINQQWYMPPV